MRSRVLVLGLLAAAGFLSAAALGRAHTAFPTGTSCTPGDVPAVVGGKNECLHVGQPCAARYQADYERYGFYCVNGTLEPYIVVSGTTPVTLTVATTGVIPPLTTSNTPAATPVVPLGVERAIKRATRVYDYLPTRTALGAYRYHDYAASSAGVSVWFRSAGREVGFHVRPQTIPCRAGPGSETGGPMRTIRSTGVRVYWRGTMEDHEAWRCIHARHGRLVVLEATDSFFGRFSLSRRTLPRLLSSVRWLG